ncbi:MAG: leucyl/phenylalanyl-tRNA--protein transferase [Wenzhouxiangellaceae bacterium]
MPWSIPVLADAPDSGFPDPARCDHPDGLLAVGGDLAPERLLDAYRSGIFPWYMPEGPILWWSPDPRAVLIPGHIHVPRRLARTLRQGRYAVTVDRAFDAVIRACSGSRSYSDGTWLTPEMIEAYQRLYRLGFAHSLEIWMDGELAGGVYGVAIGRMFYAESKFHHRRDASKIALIELMAHLQSLGYLLCDCQLWNPHLEQFGVRLIDRDVFLRIVRHAVTQPPADWTTKDESHSRSPGESSG